MAVPTTQVTSLFRAGFVVVLAIVAGACDSDSAVRRERPRDLPAGAVGLRRLATVGPDDVGPFERGRVRRRRRVPRRLRTYVTGKFEGTATLGGESLASAGAADIPFARFDAQGQPVWAKRFGGPGEDNLFDVDANADGAVATGAFSGTVAFGSTTLTSSGPWDCVIVALAPDGETRWARAFGGPGRDGCNEVTIDRSGAVTTSIDTQGEWTPVDGPPLPRVRQSDTVLMRLTCRRVADVDAPREWRPATSEANRSRSRPTDPCRSAATPSVP